VATSSQIRQFDVLGELSKPQTWNEFGIASDTPPSFTLEAVDATKTEFVTQPIAIRIVVGIASRSVATVQTLDGIIENQG
jgi:hypothetical protein